MAGTVRRRIRHHPLNPTTMMMMTKEHHTMDTVIRTHEPVDLGGGPQNTVRVPDSKYKIDDDGHLHVYAEGHEESATLAINADLWSTVVRGDITFNDDDGAALLVRRNR